MKNQNKKKLSRFKIMEKIFLNKYMREMINNRIGMKINKKTQNNMKLTIIIIEMKMKTKQMNGQMQEMIN